ncbi:thiol-disulfide oxidoreductase DCC family protein [Pseudomonas capeferrum]|uniref:thiol-disulfide oxidoreductase DCC family protein n=1 Tax=Pseudomonas capeferrum TaxID=1495066 RepID=UPI0015E48CE0|nr:thiol-disulfide oxidoreductase DCC family protein [Pseudomonas capeferrum]MBA1201873.1 thiol-disulfide oxidoreductase DCC family protein [Pseudomonas capeferrum]
MPAYTEYPTPAPILSPGETVVLFDGVCKLCNGLVRFLIRHDPAARIRLATVQSPEGQRLLAWAGLPLDRFNTMAVIRDNRCWIRSNAFFEVAGELPGAWRAFGVLRVLPRGLRDWAYDRIALNRYRLFGRYDNCPLPTAEHQRRFLKSTV